MKTGTDQAAKNVNCRGFVTAYALFTGAALLFSGCASRVPPAQPVPQAIPPSQRPYQVYGIWYYPIPSATGYAEDGIASWYGDDFHGKPTSSGEIYNMYDMTAAHKILPLGTHVKVINKTNGTAVILRVNDRGPFVDRRIIDLSYTAAHRLGMLEPGTIPVRVEAVQVAEQAQVSGRTVWKAEAVPNFRFGNFAIQIGAFSQVGNALKLRQALQPRYDKVSIQPPRTNDRERYFRVQVGAYTDLVKAQGEADALKRQGYTGAFVVAVDEKQG